MSTEDSHLLQQFSEPNSRNWAFHQLVEKYSGRLYSHIRRMVLSHDDTDDVLQNTWIKVWQNLDNFRAESGLYTWLYKIATNESLVFIRKRKRKMAENYEEAIHSSESTGFAGPGSDEIQHRLQKAILQLPDKQRLVFNLRYYDEMPYEEMSQVLGTSVGALKASYHHAAKKVGELVQQAN